MLQTARYTIQVMELSTLNKKLEPGVFQGTPDSPDKKVAITPRVIRTMKSDASEAIRDQEETTVSIALAEQKKNARLQAEAQTAKAAQPETTPVAPKPIGRIVIVFIILIIIGLLGLAYVFVLPKVKAIQLPKITIPSFGSSKNTQIATTTIPAVAPLMPSLITADTEMQFNINKVSSSEAFSKIKQDLKQELAIGFVKNIYFSEVSAGTSLSISANRLVMYANVKTPDILTRSLEKSFMVGFLGQPGNIATPFLIFKVSSNDTGLAGMLEWETTLPHFFDTIFGTNTEGGVSSTVKFRDVIVSGKDARSITNSLGKSLMYAFANPTTIVIADNQATLEALLSLVSTPTSR